MSRNLSEDLVDRLDELRVAALEEWIRCPSCASKEGAKVGKDPADEELTLFCEECHYNDILVSGECINYDR